MWRLGVLYIVTWILAAAATSAGAATEGNLIVNPGAESQELSDWTGSSAVVQRVETNPHSGTWCLHISDQSASVIGAATSRPVSVQQHGGERYYAEAWVRVDPGFTMRTGYGFVAAEVRFFDANERCLSAQKVGGTFSSQWSRVSAVVAPPENAAFAAFRVTSADKVAQLLGAAFADDFYLAPLNQAEAAGRVVLSSPPKPPKEALEYKAPSRPTDGADLALTVEKLTNGFDPQRPFIIWSLGSSFMQFLGDGDELIAAIRRRFPEAPEIVYRTMIGGSTPFDFLRGWARHLAVPDQPDLVLIYNYGSAEALERLIVELRAHTTADIIVPTLHWCDNHQPEWPDPDAANKHMDPVALRKVCERHGVEFVENRRELTQYMLANGLAIKDLLVDSVHETPYAAKMINENIARHFHRADRFAYDPRSRERRIEVEAPSDVLRTTGDWKPTKDGRGLIAVEQPTSGARTPDSIEVQFTGTRMDLIGRREPNGGIVRVWIDGKPAQESPVYRASYVQPGPDNFIDLKNPKVDFLRPISDRCPHGVSLGLNILPQQWTITMTSSEGDYELAGSVTGPDGKGNALKPFTSRSGQIIIEPALWRLPNTNRPDDRFTFEVYRCARGQVDFSGPAEKFRARLVENLPSGRHTLRIEAQGNGPVIVDAFDVFEPPEKSSD